VAIYLWLRIFDTNDCFVSILRVKNGRMTSKGQIYFYERNCKG
jgi:hypothetical protein